MMKIIQITDTHLVPPPELLYGPDPTARLKQILDHVLDRHGDADLLVITGDLSNNGDPRAYEALRNMLKGFPLPVRLLLGNHDLRGSFRDAFPEQPVDPAGFVQSVLDTPDGGFRLLFLDTLSEGEIGGRYCETRADWLRDRLTEVPEMPVCVFLHHPPVPHGMAHFDHIGFHDQERLMTVLRAHPGGVRHIAFGHIHIPLNGVTADGIGYHSGRGSTHQLLQLFENPTPGWVDGPLNYDIIRVGADGVSVHGVDTIAATPIAPVRFCPGP